MILNEAYKGSLAYKSHQDGSYDENWLKEFELFYNKQLGSTPYVKRIFLKTNEKRGKIAGFVDIRPVSDGSEVCEAYLVPPKHLETKRAYIKCNTKRDYYGKTLCCTPYIMPDCTFGMCMQTAIWICLKILEGGVEKTLTLPEIQSLAHGTPYADREGLDFNKTARIFRMSKANAIYKNNVLGMQLKGKQMLNELYAYVESFLPVIIGVDTKDLSWWKGSNRGGYHVLVVIGHTMSENKNEVDGFIVHDESALPYVHLSNDELLKAWHVPKENLPAEYQSLDEPVREMIVAVPPEISLPYNRAFQQFNEFLQVLIARDIIDFELTPNLEFRSFLNPGLFGTPIKSMFKALKECKQIPEYVWFIFIFDKNDKRDDWRKAKGIFIRDATMKSDFRLVYLQKEQTSIYQLKSDITYQRWNNQSERKTLKI